MWEGVWRVGGRQKEGVYASACRLLGGRLDGGGESHKLKGSKKGERWQAVVLGIDHIGSVPIRLTRLAFLGKVSGGRAASNYQKQRRDTHDETRPGNGIGESEKGKSRGGARRNGHGHWVAREFRSRAIGPPRGSQTHTSGSFRPGEGGARRGQLQLQAAGRRRQAAKALRNAAQRSETARDRTTVEKRAACGRGHTHTRTRWLWLPPGCCWLLLGLRSAAAEASAGRRRALAQWPRAVASAMSPWYRRAKTHKRPPAATSSFWAHNITDACGREPAALSPQPSAAPRPGSLSRRRSPICLCPAASDHPLDNHRRSPSPAFLLLSPIPSLAPHSRSMPRPKKIGGPEPKRRSRNGCW